MPGGRPRTRTEPEAVKSVGKVLDILEHLGQARGPVSVSEVARDTGLNVSTAFRQLQTLVSRGFVEQDAAHRGYAMGPRLYQIASAYLRGHDLAAVARPHLDALRDEIGETAYLATLRRDEIVQLGKADGQQVVSAAIRTAQREPAYCTATGKVLLAGLAPDALAGYLANVELRAYTSNTITDRAVLEREIAAVRRQGYGLDIEEYAEDLCCLGVPVREAQGGAVVAALSIAMPKLRFRRALVAGWRRKLEDKAALIAPQAGLVGA